MPKAKVSVVDQKNERLRQLIRLNRAMYDITADELHTRMHISKATLYNRIKDPESMTLRELRKLKAVLKIDSLEECL